MRTKRITYKLTIQRDGRLQAQFRLGADTVPSSLANLNLSSLDIITKDYLPLLETDRQQPRDRLQRFGTLLYQLLFSPPIAGHFEELAWRKIEEQPEMYRLAISLEFQEGLRSDVAALPWEFIYCPRGETFLATDPRVAFSRCPTSTSSSIPLKSGTSLRILLVRLQPEGVAQVALTRLKNVLYELAEQNDRVLPPLVLENPMPSELEEELTTYKPHILHLLAHGRFEDRGTHFALVDNFGKAIRWYRDRSLADLFQVIRPRLVLFQACEGGRASDINTFAQGAIKLVHRNIPAVVAMQYPITNRTGWLLSETIYEQLAAGVDLDIAVQIGRRKLAMSDTQAPDDHSNRDFGGVLFWMQPGARHLFDGRENNVSRINHDYLSTAHLINLIITAPDGVRFEVTVSPEILIDQLTQAFLEQWSPPTEKESRRYVLNIDTPDGPTLSPIDTIEETAISDGTELVLFSEPLMPESPVRLNIEDRHGNRFTTAVLLKTSIFELASAFLQETSGHQSVVVELIGGPGNPETNRTLNLNNSLFDEGISDEDVLRIYQVQSSSQEKFYG
jgi:hypothetical protein